MATSGPADSVLVVVAPEEGIVYLRYGPTAEAGADVGQPLLQSLRTFDPQLPPPATERQAGVDAHIVMEPERHDAIEPPASTEPRRVIEPERYGAVESPETIPDPRTARAEPPEPASLVVIPPLPLPPAGSAAESPPPVATAIAPDTTALAPDTTVVAPDTTVVPEYAMADAPPPPVPDT
ncbi:MAG: hypothetical protein KC729_07335, partial [Candidatus Eisenbacteria bacterium]|nr:hypothetical protein [Candidatus Eisenbacteria bacterium]